MIKVLIFSSDGFRREVAIDADDAAIVSPTAEVWGEDILILEKAGKEVAWFRTWSYAMKEENISE